MGSSGVVNMGTNTHTNFAGFREKLGHHYKCAKLVWWRAMFSTLMLQNVSHHVWVQCPCHVVLHWFAFWHDTFWQFSFLRFVFQQKHSVLSRVNWSIIIFSFYFFFSFVFFHLLRLALLIHVIENRYHRISVYKFLFCFFILLLLGGLVILSLFYLNIKKLERCHNIEFQSPFFRVFERIWE